MATQTQLVLLLTKQMFIFFLKHASVAHVVHDTPYCILCTYAAMVCMHTILFVCDSMKCCVLLHHTLIAAFM